MNSRNVLLLAAVVGMAVPTWAIGADRDDNAVDAAIRRGLPLVEQAAHRYPTHRECFSCHHQTLPLLAMTEARRAGFSIDAEIYTEQWEHTRNNFANRLETLRTGGQVGGHAATVSYGLWTALIVDAPSDDVTDAMRQYLLKKQSSRGGWKPQSDRPPLEGTELTTTVLSAYGLSRLPRDESSESVAEALQKAEALLESAEPVDQQERVFLYWHLRRRASSDEKSATRAESLLATIYAKQSPDGGWAQLDELESDAYATGQTLYLLLDAGVSPSDPTIRKGIGFLLSSQQEDGSWHVVTRSKPIQKWFDNGDPHDTDQFISTPSSCWALAALAKTLPEKPAPPPLPRDQRQDDP